jgi:hypothetical protein
VATTAEMTYCRANPLDAMAAHPSASIKAEYTTHAVARIQLSRFILCTLSAYSDIVPVPLEFPRWQSQSLSWWRNTGVHTPHAFPGLAHWTHERDRFC